MLITFEESGFADYVYWQKNDVKIVDKINNLIKSIRQGVYSRRIDLTNRLVYKYTDEAIIIVSRKGHYN